MAVWCAVSSEAQASDEKSSLSEQEQRGRDFAASLNGEVVAVYRTAHSRDLIFYDEAAAEMESYRRLREDVQADRFDVLWALDTDRLGRDPALSQQVFSLVEKRGKAEVYLHSSPHVIGQKGTGHRYLAAITAVRAGEEQQRRVGHHRMGMKARVRRGLIANHPPAGYEAIRDPTSGKVAGYRLTRDARAVEMMTDLFLRGYSYAEIGRRVQEAGHQPVRAESWTHSAVWQILHNDTYAGLPSWGDHRADEPSGAIPVLWDEATYAAVLLERKRRGVKGFRKGQGPLTGVAFCQRCGEAMSRYTWTSAHGDYRYLYLRCSTHRKRYYSNTSCHCNNIKEEKVLEAVGDFLAWLGAPEVLAGVLEERAQPHNAAQLERALQDRECEVAAIEDQRRRLARLASQGQMDGEMYRQTDDELLRELETKCQEASDLRRALDALPDLRARTDLLQRIVDNWQEILESLPGPELAATLQAAGIRVFIEDNEVQEIGIF